MREANMFLRGVERKGGCTLGLTQAQYKYDLAMTARDSASDVERTMREPCGRNERAVPLKEPGPLWSASATDKNKASQNTLNGTQLGVIHASSGNKYSSSLP